jgi:hypothetical protein
MQNLTRHNVGEPSGHIEWSNDATDLLNKLKVSAGSLIVASKQEGGDTIFRGTFTPGVADIAIEVDLSASDSGWAGSYMTLEVGVLPTPAPAPWETAPIPSKLLRADNLSDSALPGVTEFTHTALGIVRANGVYHLSRRVELDGLTPLRVYQWEVRQGGISGAKFMLPFEGSHPVGIALEPVVSFVSPLYAWVAYTGTNKVALVQTGQAGLYDWFGYSSDMIAVATITLTGTPGTPALRPVTTDYLAIASGTKLAIVNRNTLKLVGEYNLPGAPDAISDSCVWTADGSKLWVGTLTAGKLYRFDAATLAFDGTSIALAGATFARPLSLSKDGSILYACDFWAGKLFKIPLGTNVPAQFGATLPGAGPGMALERSDGSVIYIEGHDDQLVCLNPDGSVKSTSLTMASGANIRSSLALSADETQAYWTNDAFAGWSWVDSGQKINGFNLFGDSGAIAAGPDDTILLTCGSVDRIQQWPGGSLNIRPSPTDPNSFGAEWLDVHFEGVRSVTVG